MAPPTTIPVQRRTIAGVTSFVVPGAPEFGCAGLVIGTGVGHEPLAFSGWLYLLVSGALDEIDEMGVRPHATLQNHQTSISLVGARERAAQALTLVTERLREPSARTSQFLRTALHDELMAEPLTPVHESWRFRFGANGPAVAAWPPFGLRRDTLMGVPETAARLFTTENCRFFFDHEPPPGWQHALRPGPAPRVTIPEQRATEPAWFASPLRATTISGIVSRSPAAVAFTQLLHQDLTTLLRTEHHAAYSPSVDYCRITDEHAVVVANAGIHHEDAANLTEEVVNVVRRRMVSVTESELDALRQRELWALRQPTTGAQACAQAAVRDFDQPPGESSWNRPQFATVQASDITRIARQVVDSLLLGVGKRLAAARLNLPEWTNRPRPVPYASGSGRRVFEPINPQHRQRRAFLTANGLWIGDGQTFPSVQLDRVAVAGLQPDGSLALLECTGEQLLVHPADWHHGDELVRAILARLHPSVLIGGGRAGEELL